MKISCYIIFPVAAFAALMSLPDLARAQSILLAGGNFALLAQSTITNDDATTSTISSGNVGLSPGSAITGFAATDGGTAVLAGGGAIEINTGDANQAVADYTTVYNGLAAMSTTTGDNFTSQDLGGKILFPGVYTSDSAATQGENTILYLNANGQNNAVWVFQIAGTLIMGMNSMVEVINPGSDPASDGVFWAVSTAITFQGDDTIVGNYIAGSAVTLSAGVSGDGRIMAGTAITLNAPVNLDSEAGNGNSYDGGLKYNGPGDTNVVVIPEPAEILWMAPVGAMGWFLWLRLRSRLGRRAD